MLTCHALNNPEPYITANYTPGHSAGHTHPHGLTLAYYTVRMLFARHSLYKILHARKRLFKNERIVSYQPTESRAKAPNVCDNCLNHYSYLHP